MKKVFAIVLCMTMLMSAFSMSANASARVYLHGDIDLDGKVDVSDVIALRGNLRSWYNDNVGYLSDLDLDGKIDISDVVLLRKAIFGEHAEPLIPPTDDETKEQMVRDLINKYPEVVNWGDVRVGQSYGKYDDYVACTMYYSHLSADVIWVDIIDGVAFYYLCGDTVMVWKNSDFFSIRYAYEQGWITKEELRDIAYAYRALNVRFWYGF